MANTNTIKPPSFDDFTGTTVNTESVPENNAPSTYNATDSQQGSTLIEANPTYDVPLSFISDTSGPWFEAFTWAIGISAIFFTIILYALFRVIQIRLKEREHFQNEPLSPQAKMLLGDSSAPSGLPTQQSTNAQRWETVLRHSASENPNDWRLAILEADVMLDELITSMGYMGESLGEKLKQVEQGDINSIEAAWEAHKVRNRIAHEGTAHELSTREVRQVIALYEQVFKETKYI